MYSKRILILKFTHVSKRLDSVRVTQYIISCWAHFFHAIVNRNEKLSGDGKGAAIHSQGTSGVFLVFSNFLRNIALRDGGALHVEGSVSMNSCTLQDNTALEGSGGALFAVGGSASVSIRRSSFEGNSALELGPAIFSGSGTIFDVSRSNGCGNVASTGECDGVYSEITGTCADFRSTCNNPSQGQFT